MTQTLERGGVTFVCDDPLEVWRAETIFEKEPGTVKWIQSFQPGDVFYDIGANIGVYTLLAAKQVGPTGKVIACEPHLPNAVALMQNVKASGFASRVMVLTAALSSFDGWQEFSYLSLKRGSSGSQIRQAKVGGKAFEPAIVEWKRTLSLGHLLAEHWSDRPAHIKIDVDGHEPQIVRGLIPSLNSPVVSVQVETEPQHREELVATFAAEGYDVSGVHYTSNGTHAIEQGADPVSVISNTIFRRRDA
jgi:FkbM family methyltransferase